MNKHTPKIAYDHFVDNLENDHQENKSHDEIMQLAVGGGSFEAIGILERELLIQYGLQKQDYVIDVGCGSGRLAKPLSEYLQGKYLGIDVVPKLVNYAEKFVGRPDWRFETTKGLQIPEKNNQADMIVFFSVFTHLRHEETYLYLQEAIRALKPTGKIIFSFLEFLNPHNWGGFQHNLTHVSTHEPLNQFMSISAIKVWAYHLGLHVETLNLSGKVKLSQSFSLQDGGVLKDASFLGQSVCVLSKLPQPYWRQKLNNGLFRVANRLQRISVL